MCKVFYLNFLEISFLEKNFINEKWKYCIECMFWKFFSILFVDIMNFLNCCELIKVYKNRKF